MRITEATRHLDAVSTTFTSPCGALVAGRINLETVVRGGQPVPQGFKRYDFLATGGDLSPAEAKLLRK